MSRPTKHRPTLRLASAAILIAFMVELGISIFASLGVSHHSLADVASSNNVNPNWGFLEWDHALATRLWWTYGLGVSVKNTPLITVKPSWSLEQFDHPRQTHYADVVEDAVGWPLRAWSSHVVIEHVALPNGDDRVTCTGALLLHYDASRGTHSTVRMIALRPLPFGCAVDVLLFAPLVAGLLLIGTRWRTRRRRRKGLCPGCGYDMRETKTRCPECGWEKSE